MLKFMLDTQICIFTIKYRPQYMRELFKRHHDQMSISTITLMELIYGAEKSVRPERHLSDIAGFAARLDVLKYDQGAAAHTGQLPVELARAGTPLDFTINDRRACPFEGGDFGGE